MDTNKAPIFSKIELLVKTKNSYDKTVLSITKVEFPNAGMMITGNYLIILEVANDDNGVSTVGKVYHMDEISSYKTLKK